MMNSNDSPMNTTTKAVVQSTPVVRVLHPPTHGRDYCHVCESEGNIVYAEDCDNPWHDCGEITITEVVA